MLFHHNDPIIIISLFYYIYYKILDMLKKYFKRNCYHMYLQIMDVRKKRHSFLVTWFIDFYLLLLVDVSWMIVTIMVKKEWILLVLFWPLYSGCCSKNLQKMFLYILERLYYY